MKVYIIVEDCQNDETRNVACFDSEEKAQAFCERHNKRVNSKAFDYEEWEFGEVLPEFINQIKDARREFDQACDEHIERHGRNARVYISGPMTDKQTGKVSKENIEAFFKAENRLKKAGFINIVNPARVWACRFPWIYKIFGYRLTLWYDLQLLKRCDVIYLLKGWKDSVGSYAEFSLAFRLNLRVMTEWAEENASFDILGYVAQIAKEAWHKSAYHGSKPMDWNC